MLRRNRRYNRDDRYSRREYDRRKDRYDRREYDRRDDRYSRREYGRRDDRYSRREYDRREDRYDRREYDRYEDDRRYRHGRYEDEDYDYNPHDTITGRLIEGISNAFTSKKKAVKCENVTFDSAKKTGSYKNLKTGEVIKCEDP